MGLSGAFSTVALVHLQRGHGRHGLSWLHGHAGRGQAWICPAWRAWLAKTSRMRKRTGRLRQAGPHWPLAVCARWDVA